MIDEFPLFCARDPTSLARILSERHLLTSRVGAITIACAFVRESARPRSCSSLSMRSFFIN